jgi:hypothetical protein
MELGFDSKQVLICNPGREADHIPNHRNEWSHPRGIMPTTNLPRTHPKLAPARKRSKSKGHQTPIGETTLNPILGDVGTVDRHVHQMGQAKNSISQKLMQWLSQLNQSSSTIIRNRLPLGKEPMCQCHRHPQTTVEEVQAVPGACRRNWG